MSNSTTSNATIISALGTRHVIDLGGRPLKGASTFSYEGDLIAAAGVDPVLVGMDPGSICQVVGPGPGALFIKRSPGVWVELGATGGASVVTYTAELVPEALPVVIPASEHGLGVDLSVTVPVGVVATVNGVGDVILAGGAAGLVVIQPSPQPAAPTIDSVSGVDSQPTLTGTYDPSALMDLAVTVDLVTYTLVDPALTAVGGIWTLNLAVAGHTLLAGSYDVVSFVTWSGGRVYSARLSAVVVVPFIGTRVMPMHGGLTSDVGQVILAADGNEYSWDLDKGYRTPVFVPRADLAPGATVDTSVVWWDEVSQQGLGLITGNPYNGQSKGLNFTNDTQRVHWTPTFPVAAFTVAARITVASTGAEGYMSRSGAAGGFVFLGTGSRVVTAAIKDAADATIATISLPAVADGLEAWVFMTVDRAGKVLGAHVYDTAGGVLQSATAIWVGTEVVDVEYLIGRHTAGTTPYYQGATGLELLVWSTALSAPLMAGVSDGSDRSAGGTLIRDFNGVRQPAYDATDPTRLLQFSGAGAFPVLATLPDAPFPGYAAPNATDSPGATKLNIYMLSQSILQGNHQRGLPGPYGRIQFANNFLSSDWAVDGYSAIQNINDPPGGPNFINTWALEGSLARFYAPRSDIQVRCAKGGLGGAKLQTLNNSIMPGYLTYLQTVPWVHTNTVWWLVHGSRDILDGTTQAQYELELTAFLAHIRGLDPGASLIISVVSRPDLNPIAEATIQTAQKTFADATAGVWWVEPGDRERSDGVHYQGSNDGFHEIGRQLLQKTIDVGLAPDPLA